VNGQARKAGFLLHGGEAIEIEPLPPPPAAPVAEDVPVTVLYEDAAVVALDKPAGMVVHPAPGSWHGTVVNALLHRGLVTTSASGDRPGIVHRLDKETSGVLLVARTIEAQERLSRAFHDRTVEKTYLAVVLGTPRPRAASIDRPIGRHPHERVRMSTRSRRGRSAVTRYEVVESFERLSIVRVEPETGRTHQIRVHLASIGHPVLADPLYGARKGRALPDRGPGIAFERQALHAASIVFPHPVTGAPTRVDAPLPEDLARLLEALRAPFP
jgi:23S rRNA pseudouridine1911/1915/1917 synthase